MLPSLHMMSISAPKRKDDGEGGRITPSTKAQKLRDATHQEHQELPDDPMLEELPDDPMPTTIKELPSDIMQLIFEKMANNEVYDFDSFCKSLQEMKTVSLSGRLAALAFKQYAKTVVDELQLRELPKKMSGRVPDKLSDTEMLTLWCIIISMNLFKRVDLIWFKPYVMYMLSKKKNYEYDHNLMNDLQHLDEYMKDDKEVMLAAVNKVGYALNLASERLKADQDVVLAAVKTYGNALGLAPEELRVDRDTVLAAVKRNGTAIQYAAPELRVDREVVLTTVSVYPFWLKYSPEVLRADKEVVLTAVKQDGRVLKYASDALRSDREVVLAAVQNNDQAFQHASKELRADRDMVLAAVQQNGKALYYASQELRADKEVVLAAVKQNGWALNTSFDLKTTRR